MFPVGCLHRLSGCGTVATRRPGRAHIAPPAFHGRYLSDAGLGRPSVARSWSIWYADRIGLVWDVHALVRKDVDAYTVLVGRV